ncbi:MAG: metallophosphoesterase [Verrucomicrobia bacterium]|nr:metallophosphoesterase [Verrucomicrobiota bacterium]
MIRLAHISDLHCYSPTYDPRQFFSKRWIGNFNALFNRRLQYDAAPSEALIALFNELNVNHVIISGDLTTTALGAEFETARRFVDNIESTNKQVYLVPGNHDTYTRASLKGKIFYKYFENQDLPFTMKEGGIALRPLGPRWWWIGMDTSVPTPLFSSIGRFSHSIEERLEEALQSIPPGDKVVLTNHFPMFSTIHHSHDMRRCDALRAQLIRWPCVKLYLHGHVHRQSIADHRASGLPIILNSGSCGFKRRATFHTIDLSEKSCLVRVYSRESQGKDPCNWVLREEAQFDW